MYCVGTMALGLGVGKGGGIGGGVVGGIVSGLKSAVGSPANLTEKLEEVVSRRLWHGAGRNLLETPEKGFGPVEKYARTGTGGMSQGAGTYISESEGVGKHYADITSKKQYKFGDEIFPEKDFEDFINIRSNNVQPLRQAMHTNNIEEITNVLLDAKKNLKNDIRYWKINLKRFSDPDDLKRFSGYLERDIEKFNKLSKYWENPEKLSFKKERYLHEVAIPDNMTFMNWEEPLHKQPEVLSKLPDKFKEEFGDYLSARHGFAIEQLDGMEFYKVLTRYAKEGGLEEFASPNILKSLEKGEVRGDIQASDALKNFGIDGNKYRGNMGKGKYYNYVIFDHEKAKIIKSTLFSAMVTAALQQQLNSISPSRSSSTATAQQDVPKFGTSAATPRGAI